MPIINQEDWDKWVKNNDDPYGGCCVNVAREVMRMLDEINNDNWDAHQLICDADNNIKAGGITGFMAGAAAQMISHCHSKGEIFKKKWNKSHGVEDEDAKGVVNPAIVTIETKDED